jgi:hypothetical protein
MLEWLSWWWSDLAIFIIMKQEGQVSTNNAKVIYWSMSLITNYYWFVLLMTFTILISFSFQIKSKSISWQGLRRDLNPPQAVSFNSYFKNSQSSTAAYTNQAILRRPTSSSAKITVYNCTPLNTKDIFYTLKSDINLLLMTYLADNSFIIKHYGRLLLWSNLSCH